MERDMAFFKGVFQIESDFDGTKIKFPVFYYDASSMTAIFYARASKLREILPKKEYHPLTIFPGVGMVAITVFAYRDTDINPYNELSISIPLSYRRHSLIPVKGIISQFRRREFHVYIHHLPVTTQIALDGGVIVYNYPKFLARIEFEKGDEKIQALLEEKGELILKLRGKKIPAEKSMMMRYVTYPVKEGKAQHADVLINAKKFGYSFSPSAAQLELGEKHPIARELKKVLISRKVVQYQYTPEFQSILYAPSRLE